ncbi:ATP-binding protein [Streptomyces sp. 8N706]|uniref:ATP-binding protein n=1 Tax=Streptomyces sp. 8N706 TaxID=3457416 RepID=UPI003FD01C77
MVSELITNALRHDGGRYTLELSAGHNTLNVAVSDPSPAPPRERTPDLNGGGGFGWPMARRLAHSLTVTPGPGPGNYPCPAPPIALTRPRYWCDRPINCRRFPEEPSPLVTDCGRQRRIGSRSHRSRCGAGWWSCRGS